MRTVERVRVYMAGNPAGTIPAWTGGLAKAPAGFDPAKLQEDLDKVRDVYRAAGYKNAVVGEPQLVAYVSWREGAPTEVPALRRWVQQRLPDYMMPGTFMALDELPLTANGKIDRARLPEPQWSPVATDHLAPRAATEQRRDPAPTVIGMTAQMTFSRDLGNASMVEVILASSAGGRYRAQPTICPSRIRLVTSARAAIVVQHSNTASPEGFGTLWKWS